VETENQEEVPSYQDVVLAFQEVVRAFLEVALLILEVVRAFLDEVLAFQDGVLLLLEVLLSRDEVRGILDGVHQEEVHDDLADDVLLRDEVLSLEGGLLY